MNVIFNYIICIINLKNDFSAKFLSNLIRMKKFVALFAKKIPSLSIKKSINKFYLSLTLIIDKNEQKIAMSFEIEREYSNLYTEYKIRYNNIHHFISTFKFDNSILYSQIFLSLFIIYNVNTVIYITYI